MKWSLLRNVLSKKAKTQGVLICTWCYLKKKVVLDVSYMHACFLLQESSKCCSPPINVVVRTAFECASRHMLKALKHYGSCFYETDLLKKQFYLFVSLIPSHVQFVFNEPEHGDYYANSFKGKSLVLWLGYIFLTHCFMSCSFNILCQMGRE